MAELKCPHCGQNFTVDDAELASITNQIRDILQLTVASMQPRLLVTFQILKR